MKITLSNLCILKIGMKIHFKLSGTGFRGCYSWKLSGTRIPTHPYYKDKGGVGRSGWFA